MGKRKPPKRRVRTLPLNPDENERFLDLMREQGAYTIAMKFIRDAGLFLSGRVDGPQHSGARPCGYLFISEASFDSCQNPIAHLSIPPSVKPARVTFRQWLDVLPFEQKDWDALDDDDRQAAMKSITLAPSNVDRAVRLAKVAKETFLGEFDITVDRNS